MVKSLTSQDHELIHAAIKQARARTSAHIHVTVLPISDDYHDYALFYGIALGSLIALVLWRFTALSDFPLLLTITLGIALLFDVVPRLRFLCMPFTPRAIKHHRAGRAALHDFHALQNHIPQGEAFILLFVSVAERYVHVITNKIVHQKLPDDWHRVTEDFAVTMRKKDIADACTQAIDRIADLASTFFVPQI